MNPFTSQTTLGQRASIDPIKPEMLFERDASVAEKARKTKRVSKYQALSRRYKLELQRWIDQYPIRSDTQKYMTLALSNGIPRSLDVVTSVQHLLSILLDHPELTLSDDFMLCYGTDDREDVLNRIVEDLLGLTTNAKRDEERYGPVNNPYYLVLVMTCSSALYPFVLELDPRLQPKIPSIKVIKDLCRKHKIRGFSKMRKDTKIDWFNKCTKKKPTKKK